MKQICSLVSVRSARLIAAAICGIITHLQRDKPKHAGEPPPRNCIAVDGGVLVRYRFYRELLVQGVRETLGDAVADQARTALNLWQPLWHGMYSFSPNPHTCYTVRSAACK